LESKSHLRFYVFLGLAFVASVLFIYREAIFQDKAEFESKVGTPINNVLLRSMEGGAWLHGILEQAKTKRTIISLWATWCDPCIKELPEIVEALPRLRSQGVSVLLVNYDGGDPNKTIPQVKAWLLSRRLSLNTYFDFDEKLLENLKISALPFSLAVDENKKILWMEMGTIDWKRVSF
jgi:thiol-disulfide isomerase/thioredoxin